MDDFGEDDPYVPPRPGSHCAYHPDREAVVRCVLCDRDVCFGCFFPDLGRCQRCIESHPEEIAPPVPFETNGVLRGLVPTLAGAFSPRVTAPSFAIGDSIGRPFAFFLLTFTPLALLRGVIPFTHRLHFGRLGQVTVTPGSMRHDLALDLARAAGLSLLQCTVEVVALAVCFASLVAAFGRPESRRIAMRTLGYRAFLLPLGGVYGLFPMAIAWLGPSIFGQNISVLVLGILPLLPFYLALHRTGRSVGRIDMLPGLFVVLVPWVFASVVSAFVFRAMMPMMPAEMSGP